MDEATLSKIKEYIIRNYRPGMDLLPHLDLVVMWMMHLMMDVAMEQLKRYMT